MKVLIALGSMNIIQKKKEPFLCHASQYKMILISGPYAFQGWQRKNNVLQISFAMFLILIFLNFRSDARSEIGDPVHAGEEEEEEEEEILGSDDDEQEDPKDYVKGVSFSIGSIIDFFTWQNFLAN